jgi:hypothetical protein
MANIVGFGALFFYTMRVIITYPNNCDDLLSHRNVAIHIPDGGAYLELQL